MYAGDSSGFGLDGVGRTFSPVSDRGFDEWDSVRLTR